MASDKKRRKEVKQIKLRQQRAGPRKVKDGDRRRRGGPSVKDAYLRKQILQYEGLPVPEEQDDQE